MAFDLIFLHHRSRLRIAHIKILSISACNDISRAQWPAQLQSTMKEIFSITFYGTFYALKDESFVNFKLDKFCVHFS